jgi:uncharacterized phage protein (TIGR02218 family)
MSLTDFVLNNSGWFEADCITITLPNGSVLRVTNHQNDLVIGGQKYYASKYGKWARGSITYERNAVTETELKMTCDPTVLFPNSVSTPMFQRSKLFMRSTVQIITATLDLKEVVQGTTTIFAGYITSPSIESSLVTFKCSDPSYLMQAAWPKRVICAGCPFTVFDNNCSLNRSSFAMTRTVLSGSTQTSLVVSALGSVGNDPLPYAKGYIVPTSGEAQGWSIGVITQPDSTHLSLAPFDLPIKVGDTFTLYPGCDGKQTTCDQKFNNLTNFGGFPQVPGPETALQGG